jgi:PhnB protein
VYPLCLVFLLRRSPVSRATLLLCQLAGFSAYLSRDDAGLLRDYWEKLSASGTITMPMQKRVWGDEFGMCTDKFGVSWMVNISRP